MIQDLNMSSLKPASLNMCTARIWYSVMKNLCVLYCNNFVVLIISDPFSDCDCDSMCVTHRGCQASVFNAVCVNSITRVSQLDSDHMCHIFVSYILHMQLNNQTYNMNYVSVSASSIEKCGRRSLCLSRPFSSSLSLCKAPLIQTSAHESVFVCVLVVCVWKGDRVYIFVNMCVVHHFKPFQTSLFHDAYSTIKMAEVFL